MVSNEYLLYSELTFSVPEIKKLPFHVLTRLVEITRKIEKEAYKRGIRRKKQGFKTNNLY